MAPATSALQTVNNTSSRSNRIQAYPHQRRIRYRIKNRWTVGAGTSETSNLLTSNQLNLTTNAGGESAVNTTPPSLSPTSSTIESTASLNASTVSTSRTTTSPTKGDKEQMPDLSSPLNTFHRELKRGLRGPIPERKSAPKDVPKKRILDKKPDKRNFVYLCPHKGSTFMRLPSTEQLCNTPHDIFTQWINVSVTLYGKVFQPRPAQEAYICSKKKEEAKFYTDLLGNKFLNATPTIIRTSEEECRHMKAQKTCEAGTLLPGAHSSFSTRNKLNVEFQGAIKSFFAGEQTSSSLNCLLQETTVYYNPHDMSIVSPTFDTSNCDYRNGTCETPENIRLIWTPECQPKCIPCDYVLLNTFNGTTANGIWASLDEQIALSFPPQAEIQRSCDLKRLRISEQGYAVLEEDWVNI